MISITPSAQEYIKQIIAEHSSSDVCSVLISVQKGGCSGMQYKFELANIIRPTDNVVQFDGFKILIDQGALLFLIGTELDYQKTETSAKLVFNNPNAKHNCGCGKSFQI